MRVPLALLFAALVSDPLWAEDKTGEQIYQASCLSCHGARGEGSKKHDKPLIGDRAIPQLARQIQRTMPEENPGSLSDAESLRVAEYIHGVFYSREAREKNRPPRIELARLTVRQYKNALADLVGSFRPAPAVAARGEEHGLKGEYYKGRGFRGDGNRVLTRTDPQVRFDFGTDSAVPGKAEPHEFSIRWAGSVVAPDTGDYEFVVRTEHAARLWVNDLQKPLIDAWVKSGNDTEYKGSLYLVGGRAYPLRLEYSKAKQGVDDSKKGVKPPAVKSSIALAWKAPGQAVETIPARLLAPGSVPEVFCTTAAFPPDDRSYGWERGTTISRAWDQATTDGAIEAAACVAAHLDELAGVRGQTGAVRAAKLKEFARTFAARAFRRPLTEDVKAALDQQFDAAAEPENGVKRVVLRVLKSPRFLYREVGGSGSAGTGGTDAYDTAARLSFGLWDSLPDQPLLDAAAAGRLATPEQVRAQAERLLADPRAQAKLRDFLLHWLKLDQVTEIAKDPARFPGFDAATVADLRTSLELMLAEVTSGTGADFRQLLLADSVYLNERLAKFYGAEGVTGPEFRKVKLNPEVRAGVLTHPYLMAAFAYTAQSSPIHRGVFLARNVLGVALRPPPAAVAPLAADLNPSLTTRERVALQTQPAACMSCHTVINPLGFTLEHFDAVGRFRSVDNAKPVDDTGSFQKRDGQVVKFDGIRDVARFAAGSPEVADAFIEQMFHHLVQQPVRAYAPGTAAALREKFIAGGHDVRKLAAEVMATSALTPRDAKPVKTASVPKQVPAAVR